MFKLFGDRNGLVRRHLSRAGLCPFSPPRQTVLTDRRTNSARQLFKAVVIHPPRRLDKHSFVVHPQASSVSLYRSKVRIALEHLTHPLNKARLPPRCMLNVLLRARSSREQQSYRNSRTMDSMRSLNRSLPGSSPPKQYPGEPPEQLLQSFKAAALSVTKLYKTAAADLGRARAEGYQDALDELLAYLDKEDIGLSDGEGWKIRRWATERLDGRDSVSQNMESDDEAGDKADRAASPEIQRSRSATRPSTTNPAVRTASPARTEPQAPPTIITPNEATVLPPPQGMFTFRSSHPYPQDADVTLPDLELSDGTRTQTHEGQLAPHTSGTPITFTRPARANARHTNHPTRINSRSSGPLARAAGQKRKINFAELFDISNLSHGKDAFGGGGKRGRFA